MLELPTLQTSSQTVKCSLGLCGRAKGTVHQRFRWSDPVWRARQGWTCDPFRVSKRPGTAVLSLDPPKRRELDGIAAGQLAI
jgi:hypothetical protein